MSSTAAGDTPLAGRSAVVTGASRGIGHAIALALHAAGAHVIMLGRDAAAMRHIIDREAHHGAGTLAPIAADLSRIHEIDAVAASIREQARGAPDILVNNAAQFFVRPVEETTVDDFERTLTVNLTAHFALVRAFLPDMRARGSGHVVTIGSVADERPYRGNAAYSASKFGMRGLHEVMRQELRGSGVRTTLVSPDRVDTTIWDGAVPPEWERVKQRSDMLQPADVARAVSFALTQPATVNVDELRLSRA
ncbi:MAG TPA: SDR family oxidoreductase [Gemmatimonadaceae bacterium]|nr:SDR family oxidoreductase [Gemmatimonadaceae bacterium]